MAIHFCLLVSRQGKVRLSKFYTPMNVKERSRTVKDIIHMVVGRHSKLCNFLEYNENTLIYKR
jgi:AP-1 complex subunit sigma 1/2